MQKPGHRIWKFEKGRLGTVALTLALLGVCFAGCAEEEYPLALWMQQHPTFDASARPASPASDADAGSADFDAATTPQRRGFCRPASAQEIPARLVSMSANAATGVDLVYVSDLFESFKAVCGNCHGPAVDAPGRGGYQIRSVADFQGAMNAAALLRMKSDGARDPGNPKDPYGPMPPFSSPTGGPYSKRPGTDPVKQLADLVEAWLAAGKPMAFSPKRPGGVDAGSGVDATPSQYVMSSLVGNAMTNIGYCVPDKALVGIEHDKSAKLDAMFAGLTKVSKAAPGVTGAQLVGLPERLADTDLFTLDTATLAQYGVIAFQPNYPLWSDDAGKLRFVRVPLGTSIQFDKDTQEFTIPANTRFYKTFLKKIIDTDGSYRFRKIETRLIVARPDVMKADGSSEPTALFGTYLWNSNETEATLIQTPLRNGYPFADTVLQYTTDEQLAATLLANRPLLPLETLLEGRAARHYAVPSSERCIQCHMGSNSASFILGFRPIQLVRRAPGDQGTLPEPGQKPAGADELTQLQRLIDYGIVSGMTSPNDVLPLDRSQGDRPPRNVYELAAQAYMVGNCAHCHNPRGFPSVTNPALKDILNFMPSATGGIFQFPLERYSPRIGRGPGGGTPIPYITPSLMDQPPAAWNADPGLVTSFQGEGYDTKLLVDGTPSVASPDGVAEAHIFYTLYAPWRSLIYRNVDTPFPYETNLALFPHMPMNTPGFDCRAKQIMSDWMVSIPAIRKNPEIPEYAFVVRAPRKIVGGNAVDDNPQPYVEAKPGSPGYDEATQAAEQRLGILRSGIRPGVTPTFTHNVYEHCPDTSDLIDPAVTLDPVCHAVPAPDTSNPLGNVTPARPHWVNTDLTQAPDPAGTFSVRRSDWTEVVAQQHFPAISGQAPCGQSLAAFIDAQNAVKVNVRLLQSVVLDKDFRTYATTEIPFGLWKAKPECRTKFGSAPTWDSFKSKRPLWMGQVAPSPDPQAPVYMTSPGAAVYGMICINCHGPKGDAHGRLADNLATMTGGNAIVANFADGLFGPVDSPGLHRQEAFATSMLPAGVGPNWTDVTVDDRAARYLAWMALGGTEVTIPKAILTVVADTRVLGVPRALPADDISANMLSAAKTICTRFVDASPAPTLPLAMRFNPALGWFEIEQGKGRLKNFPLVISSNGDAELWLDLCSKNNPPPVRVLRGSGPGSVELFSDVDGELIDSAAYGQNPVGNQSGGVEPTLTTANTFPWCVSLDGVTDATRVKGVPYCPFATGQSCEVMPGDAGGLPRCWSRARREEWGIRGAINAGLAVFSYVDSLVTGKPPKLAYDQCQLLP